jgi:DNA recombination protein RmuC
MLIILLLVVIIGAFRAKASGEVLAVDNSAFPITVFCLGLAVGGLLGWCMTWLYAKARTAQLEATHYADAEKIEWITNSQDRLRENFKALASESLRENADHFSGHIHRQLGSHADRIGVLKQALERNITELDGHIRTLEQKREGAYQSLTQQVLQLERGHLALRQTTEQLLAALKSGPVRGRWGEIQLRKIVELAGMTEHVSFNEQVAGDTGGRPDTLVHLPNTGHIPIDSKFPLGAFLEAMEATDETTRREKFDEHVKALKDAIRDLSNKRYWREFDPSPELVIMFVPIESCLIVAYEHEPGIIEFALEHKIILASPVTLLGFMKSIAYGWQQFTINKNAKKILAQGKELYDRVEIWMEHFRKTGEKIAATVKSYNDSIASLQSRFLPACRRFQELTAIAEELEEVEAISIGINLPPPGEKSEQNSENGT